MGTFTKGALIAEGKTKKLFAVEGNDELVFIENKTDITKFDDASLTKSFDTKAAYATTVTCRVFELLHKAGIANVNAESYLKSGGYLILAIKAKRISSTENVGDIFRDELQTLEKDFEIMEKASLEPLHHGHLAVIARYKD
jgi:fibrillarin-like rRNA methylase